MFYGYGAEVIAVADGVVTHVTDGIPDNVPQSDGSTRLAVPFSNATVSGNWISLRIADSVYAFYAHL
jgi:murein DD-endopeptidase MepM/ murein hydrolase activator NlpD